MSGPTTPTTPAPPVGPPSAPEPHAAVPAGRHPVRRTLLALGTVLAVLVALFYVGGGWYFSGRIHSDALAASPGPMVPTYNLSVTAVGPTTVTYRSSGDVSPSFDHAASYALLWDGGWAHVGPPTSTAGGEVTRPITGVTGAALAVGTPAALERDWYVGDPRTALGYDFQDVTISGPHGDLPAWYVPAARASTWTVVMVHGREGFPRELLRAMKVVHEAGLNALDITYYGDYGNAPYANGQLGFGTTEWPDVEAAVQWAAAHGTQDVVLMGNSHGAAVVAGFLQHSSQTGDVKAVVLDSAAIDLGQIIESGAAKESMPVLGTPPPSSLVAFSMWLAHLRYGVDWSAVNYTADPMWDRQPVLAIQGLDDPQVPPGVSRDLKALHPSSVQLEEFPGAQHVESWNTDRARYEAVLAAFLARVTR